MRYGVINFNRVDTTLGTNGAFAPPHGFSGDYRKFMVKQLADDPGVRQHVALVARRLNAPEPPEFVGPFAGPAAHLARGVLRRLANPPRENPDE